MELDPGFHGQDWSQQTCFWRCGWMCLLSGPWVGWKALWPWLEQLDHSVVLVRVSWGACMRVFHWVPVLAGLPMDLTWGSSSLLQGPFRIPMMQVRASPVKWQRLARTQLQELSRNMYIHWPKDKQKKMLIEEKILIPSRWIPQMSIKKATWYI